MRCHTGFLLGNMQLLLALSDKRYNRYLSKKFTLIGHEVMVCDNEISLPLLLQTRKFNSILLDLSLSYMSGLAVLDRFFYHSHTAGTTVVVFSPFQDKKLLTIARYLGADACVHPPLDFDHLVKVMCVNEA